MTFLFSLKVSLIFVFFILFRAPAFAQEVAQKMTQNRNPIQTLLKTIDGQGGLWVNGISPNIPLPPSASAQEVAKKYFESVNYDRGKVKIFKILKSEKVKIDASNYEAILIDTEAGQKIIIMQFQKHIGWWTKEFVVTQDMRNKR